MKKILNISGVFSFIYYAMLISYAGIRTTFASFWAILGTVCLGMSILPEKIWATLRLPVVLMASAVGSLSYRMIQAGKSKPEQGADYIIVLGAQVRGSKPSRSLLYRIEAAAEYMKANPDTVAIASGGQGDGEATSEACCIRRTLEKMGIQRDRIIEENRSVSTWENLRYSLGIGGRDASYIIATNSFHIYRALKTAKAVGMTRCAGLGARSHPLFQLNYFVREIFALAKLYMKLGAERIRS